MKTKFVIENYRLESDSIVIDFAKPEHQICSRLTLPIERLREWALRNEENTCQDLTWDQFGNPGIEIFNVPIDDWINEHLSNITVSKFLHAVFSGE